MPKNLIQLDPPGTFCMNSAFLRMITPLSEIRTFIEIGPGEGKLSKLLCAKGLIGTGIDFSEKAVQTLSMCMREEISSGLYRIIQADFVEKEFELQADLVFSMMVLEHVESDIQFLLKMKHMVKPGGKVVIGAPARMDSWGVEDEVSGHLRRYEKKDLQVLFERIGLKEVRVWSVGVPIANFLFGLSNLTISRSHSTVRKHLTNEEQTKLSGLRDVPYKNLFPRWTSLILNRYAMAPFLFAQRFFFNTDLGLALLACGKIE